MNTARSTLFCALLATATFVMPGLSYAHADAGLTLGYPGAYGFTQPSYVAPAQVYVQPMPLYVQPGRSYEYGQGYREPSHAWREQQERARHQGYQQRDWRDHNYGHGNGYDDGRNRYDYRGNDPRWRHDDWGR